jgi:chemosensory pili system protein ChpA (sensor histidine kinase/response regulator)
VEVQQGLHGITRETETLLLQQARVSTELQEGLMHTRMMPLVEHAPRLRRIVRQTSAELGREVELSFRGAEVEMDRHMVERMLAPIEHLLRNAIAHGIETPEQRRRAGKQPRGLIILAQVREGSEVVMRIIDDGAGINLDRVRQKAIERGLMKADAGLSDKEVVHFILESGFSTAETLTQVAGRGVGMDVVNSEIKQLGGLLEIDTRQGEGTTFTIRLPLTLSVSRALLVQAGEETYAVPMTSIQGIERLDDGQLAQLLAVEYPTYTRLGQEYELLPLAATLGMPTVATAGEAGKRPLLFAHSGDHYVAWAADNLLGSREIVVKSLGPQLSKLRGLSGATILGDGSVALILDLPLLARLGLAQRSTATVEVAASSEQPLVMVVDDSITVRKVTSRLLERNDMRPVTAKDGLDAIAQLEDVMPDVMLLDIEMPRMDGYELATHIRNTERLRHIPIIMITSRSGEKHRQRAMEIGVDFYMSKPYQETELLDNIRKLMTQRRGA